MWTGTVRLTTASVAAGAIALAIGSAAPAASPGGGPGPPAHIACSEHATGTCSESGTDSLPARSYGSQTTDTVPDHASSESTGLEPLSGQDLQTFDSLWLGIVDSEPKLSGIKSTPVRRILTCAVIARGVADAIAPSYGQNTFSAKVDTKDFFAAYLTLCIQATVFAEQHPTGPARDAAVRRPSCVTGVMAVPLLVSRTRSGYHLVVGGKTGRASGRQPLAVRCQITGNGLDLSVRPADRHKRLRSIVGPRLGIGFSNLSSGPVKLRSTFTFR